MANSRSKKKNKPAQAQKDMEQAKSSAKADDASGDKASVKDAKKAAKASPSEGKSKAKEQTPGQQGKKAANKANAKSSKKAANKKPSVFKRLSDYLKSVRSEMKRVTWPTREEVIRSSLVVVVALAFFGLLVFAIDSAVVPLLTLYSGLAA